MSVATAPPDNSLARYWEALGLKPGTDLEKLDTTYYLMVEKFPKDPTEEEQHRLQELGHAYAVLRRSCVAKETAATTRRSRTQPSRRPAVMGALLLAGCAVLAMMNMGDLRRMFVSYNSGDVVRLRGHSTPYGTVNGYERRHSFGAGEPGPAYQIQLASGESVWLSAAVVEKGMEK